MKLHSFLRSVRQALPGLASSPQKVHVVLGNESCDLDSAVSAVVTAYMLTAECQSMVVPMLHIPRADYPLKTEVKYVFDQNEIDVSMLNFLDDLSLAELHRAKKLELTLVDHNVMAGCFDSLQDAVVRVIDHHKWEASYCSLASRTVEMVGSCASLVGQKLLDSRPDLVCGTVAKLISAAILIDTANFSETAKKATPTDVQVFRQMSSHLPGIDWSHEYRKIKDAKTSVTWMAVRDLLRKDLKVVKANDLTVAISSVPLSLKKLLDMPSFRNDLELFKQHQNADAVVVMTTVTKSESSQGVDSLERGMIVFTGSEALRKHLVESLTKFDDPSLELRSLDLSQVAVGGNSDIQVFVQSNAAASRKVVLPAVRAFIQSFSV